MLLQLLWLDQVPRESFRLLLNSRPPVISTYTLCAISGSLRMNLFKPKNTGSVFLACSRLSDSRDEGVKGVRTDSVKEPATGYILSFIRYTLKKKCV